MDKTLLVLFKIILGFERIRFIIGKKQEFYDHLICGDPRKMG
jgi:hypothetical protein